MSSSKKIDATMPGRLAIIAGKGQQPSDIEKAAREQGEHPFIIRITNHCHTDFLQSEVVDLGIGELSKAVDAMRRAGCDRIILTGKVDRPPLNPLKMDADAVKLLSKVMFTGDDTALNIISTYFTEKGFALLPQHHFLHNRYVGPDFHFGPELSKEEQDAIATGIDTLSVLGNMDIGQAVIVQGRRILAIEAAEGTDQMIARCSSLIEAEGGCVAFVKMSKSGQNRDQDPPGFGVLTINALARCGIKLAALEPQHVFLTDEQEDIEAAALAHGLTLTSTQIVAMSTKQEKS